MFHLGFSCDVAGMYRETSLRRRHDTLLPGGYFDSFGVAHIPKEIRKLIGNKNITTNIYRIQPYDSVMCGYFCTGFIDFMLKNKSLLEHTIFFSPNDCKQNDKVML